MSAPGQGLRCHFCSCGQLRVMEMSLVTHFFELKLLRDITAHYSLVLWFSMAGWLTRACWSTTFRMPRILGGYKDVMQKESPLFPAWAWCPFCPDPPQSLFKWKFCKSTSAACVVQFGWQQFLAKEITKLLFSHGFLTAAKQVDVN